MRRPRVRSMSDHELVSEAIRGVVDWLTDAPVDQIPSARLEDLLGELRHREQQRGEMLCTCQTCMAHVRDPFED